MASLSGWNINTITDKAYPRMGGFAYDPIRHRLWMTEEEDGLLIRLDLEKAEFEIVEIPTEGEAKLGRLTVDDFGGVYISVNHSNKLLKYNQDLEPVSETQFNNIIDISSKKGRIGVLTINEDSLEVSCLGSSMELLWSTIVFNGKPQDISIAGAKVVSMDNGFASIVGHHKIECNVMDLDGSIREKHELELGANRWDEEPLNDPYHAKTRAGTNYLYGTSFDYDASMPYLLYAPPAGEFRRVAIKWPLDDTEPTAFVLHPFTASIISVTDKLLCFGSEGTDGPWRVFYAPLRLAKTIPYTDLMPKQDESKQKKMAWNRFFAEK